MVLSRSMLAGLNMSGVVAQPRPAYMQEADDLRGAVGDDVAGETAKRVAAGASGVHHGRHPCPNTAEVGFHAVAVHAVVDVGVKVDQSWKHQVTLYLQNAGSFV